MHSTLANDRRALIGQLMRFGLVGGFVTALGLGIYALVALVLRWNPQIGNFLGYVVAMITGYVMHSRWSFGDHGGERDHRTKVRFIVVSLISLALNSFWVWLVTRPLHLTPEWPMVPMVLITPVVTFLLNRQWVFR